MAPNLDRLVDYLVDKVALTGSDGAFDSSFVIFICMRSFSGNFATITFDRTIPKMSQA